MLLSNYDFYDIYWAITMFRWNPLYEHNYEIAKRIKGVIDASQTDNLIHLNAIRNTLAELEQIHKTDEWYWVTTENVYVFGVKTIDTPIAYQILSEGFAELLRCLEEQDENRIFDLADALHNIPIILTEHNKKFKWRIQFEISTYRRKWNHSFLKKELAIR